MAATTEESPLQAVDLLLVDLFDFRLHFPVRINDLTDRVDATRDQIRVFLGELESKNFLSQIIPPDHPGLPPSTEIFWEATRSGYGERERLLRSRGQRHRALIDSSPNVVSLVLALLMAGQIENGRLTGGMPGITAALTRAELQFYLPAVGAQDLEKAIATAEQRELLRTAQKYHRRNGILTSEDVDALEITEKGRKLYRAELAEELGLGDGASILDVSPFTSIEVFYCWQSEHTPSRDAIAKALRAAVEHVNELQGLVRPLKVVQATNPGDGAVRIDVALLASIKAARLFVADITPVAEHDDRLCPNSNVLVEVGYALASKRPERIILVSKRRPELGSEHARFTFDIDHVLRHEFDSDSELEALLRDEVTAMLQRETWLPGGPSK